MAPATPRKQMTERAISLVLPVGIQASRLDDVLQAYVVELDALDRDWEMLLIPSPGASWAPSQALAASGERIRVVAPAAGWGAAVRSGLSASTGELLCYTNWQRTPAAGLAEMLRLAAHNRELVLRANRRTRDTRIQRLGSLLFNVQCRFVLQIPAWDVNGTPKVFPRSFTRLLELRSEDDLFDAEFALVCEQAGYPVIEVPIDAVLQADRTVHTDYRAALRMYAGVPRLRERAAR
jgi:hypothetical protein